MAIIQEIEKIFFTGAAVYISTDFMDIAEARMSPGGVVLTSLQRFPIGFGSERGISGILDRIFSSEYQIPYRVAVNVRNDQLILRWFKMPNVPQKELAQAVVFAAQQHLPCPIETLTYAFKSYRGVSNFREIVIAATETKNINELVAYFRRKHILPAVIEPVPFLLSKLIALNGSASEETCLLMHYEPHSKIILCGISRKHPYFFREITAPFDIGPRWKGEDNVAYPTLGAVWPHVEADVIKSMSYMRKEAGHDVKKIYVSGFSPSHDEERISKELNVPVERHRFAFFTKDGPDKDDKYLPVLMLVLNSLKNPSLNIAPAEIVRNDMRGIKVVLLKFLAGLGVIVVLHMAFLGINAKIGLKAKLANNVENYGVINPSSPRADVELYKKSVIESALFVSDFLSKKRFLPQKLVCLSRLMPQISWVEEISFTGSIKTDRLPTLTIKGSIFDVASDSTSANKILEVLKADKDMMEGFKGANLSYVEKKISSGREITDFEVSFK